MRIEQVLYRASAEATGGRDGRAISSDGVLDVALTTPRELGGAGGVGTNPEQLFAAGYSACFLGAMKFVAARDKLAIPADVSIEGVVGIGAIPNGFGIEAEVHQPAGARCRGRAHPGGAGAHRLSILQRHAQQHRRDPHPGRLKEQTTCPA